MVEYVKNGRERSRAASVRPCPRQVWLHPQLRTLSGAMHVKFWLAFRSPCENEAGYRRYVAALRRRSQGPRESSLERAE